MKTKRPFSSIAFLSLLTIFVLSSASQELMADTIDVNLLKGKVTATSLTVQHDDYLNICSRDEAFHQPYSMLAPNKFGSSKAKEKDILSRGECRLVQVKNSSEQTIEMTVYDRFQPQAYLVLKVKPKPRIAKTDDTAAKSKSDMDDTKAAKDTNKITTSKTDSNKFLMPMQGDRRLAFCYSVAGDCGEKVAVEWCKAKGFKGAKEWEIDPRDVGKAKATRYIGSDELCGKGKCDAFESITCRTGPPTFF